MLFLMTIGEKKWKNLETDILEREDEWYQWFSLISPEVEKLPGNYGKLSKFETLLLLRIFRPDRVINGIKRYIIE